MPQHRLLCIIVRLKWRRNPQPFVAEEYMKILTAVFLFLGIVFVSAPSLADVSGNASTGFGGSNVTPMNLTPAEVTPMNLTGPNITPMNMAPPNIMPATGVNPAHIEHFQAALAAQQQAQQKAWEDQMIDRQKQLDTGGTNNKGNLQSCTNVQTGL